MLDGTYQSMETSTKRVLYYSDENSSLSYEICDGWVVLHSEIVVWKPSVFKQCLRVLRTLFEELKNNSMYNVMAVTPNPAFSKLFGGVSVSSFTHENKEYEVVVWDLK